MATCLLARWFLAAALAIVSSVPVFAQDKHVDVELVLAVDVSASIDAQQAQLQREGYVSALTDDSLIARIRAGFLGRIAVAYVEWSHVQTTIVDWTIIESKADALAFSDKVLTAPLVSGSATSISGAIDYSVVLLENNGIEGTRRVIDVSSDGRNSAGGPLVLARQRALNAGIVINGLPIIQREETGRPVDPGLEDYYASNVIGGPGAFIVVAEGIEAFPEAIRKKLFIEIAGHCAATADCRPTMLSGIVRPEPERTAPSAMRN